MEKWKLRALELLTEIAFAGKKYPAQIPFYPQKTTVSGLEEPYFKRNSPERHSISSLKITEMLRELEADTDINIHSVMILKDGDVISECAAPGYGINVRYLSHSMSKTLTAIAIGFLRDEGAIDIDAPLTSFFPEYTPKDKNFSMITVRHALTMSTGIAFSEMGSVTESEWKRAYFDSKVEFTPGSMFAYNSMNSYMLSAITVKLSGMSLLEFLKVKLFHPLKIKNVFWEIGPEDIEKGGWGVHLSTESWAKIGLMLLSGGVFENTRILSEEWISEMISTQMKAPESTGDFNYGYQLWVAKDNSEFLLSGMLGQFVWCCPKNKIVAVVTAGNNTLFQKNPALSIIRKYLGGNVSEDAPSKPWDLRLLRKAERAFYDSRRAVKLKEAERGLSYLLGFKNSKRYDTAWDDLLGKYVVRNNNQGILPIFVRAMQNNYSGGIDAISFRRENDHIIFTSVEDGKAYEINSGFYDYASSVINCNGEKYAVRSVCEAAKDENGQTVYKIEIIFPELPNSRLLTVTKTDHGEITVQMRENPDQRLAEPLIEAIYTTNPKFSFAVGLLERRFGDRFIAKRLESLFNPILRGVEESLLDTQSLSDDDALEQDMKLLSSLVLEFADSADED